MTGLSIRPLSAIAFAIASVVPGGLHAAVPSTPARALTSTTVEILCDCADTTPGAAIYGSPAQSGSGTFMFVEAEGDGFNVIGDYGWLMAPGPSGLGRYDFRLNVDDVSTAWRRTIQADFTLSADADVLFQWSTYIMFVYQFPMPRTAGSLTRTDDGGSFTFVPDPGPGAQMLHLERGTYRWLLGEPAADGFTGKGYWYVTLDVAAITPVPEPSRLALTLLGLAACAVGVKRRQGRRGSEPTTALSSRCRPAGA